MMRVTWPPRGGRLRVGATPLIAQPILPTVSIPPFLTPPAGVTPRRTPTEDASLAVLDNGELLGQPRGSAVLVPGFTGSKEDYITLFEPLAQRSVRAVAL